MILHDAIVADNPRIIGLMPVNTRSVAHDTIQVPETAVIAAENETEATPPPARENRLSFESVAAWLVVQDEETRKACASLLTDELTQVHESAKADGYAAGEQAGRAEAQQASESLHSVLKATVGAAEAAFENEREKLADLCVEIVAEAFAKMAGPLLATREAATGAVLEVLRRVKEGRELTIRVNAMDLSAVRAIESQLIATLGQRKFTVVADTRIELGGCIVESKLGSLDGRMEVQLRELYQVLRAAKSPQPEIP